MASAEKFSRYVAYAMALYTLRSIADDLIPDAAKDYFSSRVRRICNRFSSQMTVVIEESDGLNPNKLFEAANSYLGNKACFSSKRIKANKPEKVGEVDLTVDKNEEISDEFDGVKLNWVLISSAVQKPVSDKRRQSGFPKLDARYFELSFNKKYRDVVLRKYLQYVLLKAKEMADEKKVIKLHTVDYNGTDYWGSINLNHPANFETIAMDPVKKKELIDDLDMFIARKDFYKRVGKAWKRGYLFHGPPGTGKSSLVAAMANYLKFDVYDLDLKEVQCNSDLRRLLIGTGNRSILVIEDIDYSLESADDDKFTLSGLLNFIDGLWSSCGDERIVVLTTNNRDKLEPVLLRPGRMDVHVHMSYCRFSAFKTLAFNYLKIEEHSLFREIDELLQNADATPAEVAGELMKSDVPEVSLRGLIGFLEQKKNSVQEEK